MAGYTLRITHRGAENASHVEDLDELAERVALEQLAHELNPVDAGGYVVTFAVTEDYPADSGSLHRVIVDGLFHVRAAQSVTAPVETSNSVS